MLPLQMIIDVEHPAAKMIIEIAKTQDDKVGDGTTTAVIIAGELLNLAQELMEQSVHPTIVFKGYRKALLKSKEILQDLGVKNPTIVFKGYRKALLKSKEILQDLGVKIDVEDKATLIKIAETAMNSKLIAGARSHFAEIAVKAVTQIREDRGMELL